MASVVKIKRSSVQGKAPTTGNLETGELALNLRDQKLFSSNGSVVFEIGSNTTSSHIGTLTVGNSSPYTFPTSDGSENFVLKTDGSGTLSFVSVASVSSNTSLDDAVLTGNTTSREITVGGLTVGAITFPNTDGTNGQVLTTDGSGNLSFQTISGGGGTEFKEFAYIASEGQQSFSGADRYGQAFSYTSEKISVFLNGILQVANTDYLASNTTSVHFTQPTANNDEVTIQSFDSIGNFVDVNASITSNTQTTSTASQVVADSFGTADYRTAKYIVQVNNRENSNQFQSSEVLLIHNGSATFITEYATLNTNGIIASIDSDISGGSVRLLVTPTVANTEIKVLRTGVTV